MWFPHRGIGGGLLVLCLLGWPGLADAQGTLTPTAYQTVFSASGVPIPGALIFTYTAGTSTPAPTYADVGLTSLNTNPIVTDAAGRFVAFLPQGKSFKFVFQDAAGVTLRSVDNLSAVPTTSGNVDVTGTAGEPLVAGAVAYLSDGSGGKTAGRWYNADSANPYSATLNAVGFAVSALVAGGTGTFREVGYVTGLAGLTTGSVYYVGAAGALTSTPPVNARPVGQADTPTSLITGPPPTVAAVPALDVTATAGEVLSAGQAVYVSDGSGGKTVGQVYRADATTAYSSARALIVGIAPAAIGNGAIGVIRIGGRVPGLSGLTIGASYYASNTPGAVTSTKPANARLLGLADTTTSLLLAPAPGPLAVNVYPTTLTPVQNTVTPTTILSFDVPANAWTAGDLITVWLSSLNKNNKGSTGTVTATVSAGAGAAVTLSGAGFGAGAWQNSATEFQAFGYAFALQRVGADVWVIGPGLLINPAIGGLSSGPFNNVASAAIDGLSTPANFTTTVTVTLRLTLSAADATFYLKPQAATVVHYRN